MSYGRYDDYTQTHLFDPVLRKVRPMTDDEERGYWRTGSVKLPLQRTTPGTMRFVHQRGKKILMDIVQGEPATLPNGALVIVSGFPVRFCRAWGLPRRETYDATVERRRTDGKLCLSVAVSENWYDNVQIPVRQLSRRAEIVPAGVL